MPARLLSAKTAIKARLRRQVPWEALCSHLVKAQVWKYKSIEDSSPVGLADAVTVLVGKNESGKTAFLEALHKAMPLDEVKYDYVADY